MEIDGGMIEFPQGYFSLSFLTGMIKRRGRVWENQEPDARRHTQKYANPVRGKIGDFLVPGILLFIHL